MTTTNEFIIGKNIIFRFLLQCLEDLDHNLRKINSRLFVVRGQPADALPKLFKEWGTFSIDIENVFVLSFNIQLSARAGTTCLTFEEDPEPFGKVRDHKITQLCKELEIEVIQVVSHTLYKLEKYARSIAAVFERMSDAF